MPNFARVSTLPSDSQFSRVLRPVRAAPNDIVRPTRAEIDLSALRHNFAVIQRRSRSPVWPVIKADGYGHGGKAIARTLERAGAKGFCVALVEEAIELREAGVFAPILVMGGHYDGAEAELLHHGITAVVGDPGAVHALAEEARHGDYPEVRVHLKVDTGMGRLGVTLKELPAMVETLKRYPQVRIEGLMTHFASADVDATSVQEQLGLFRQADLQLQRAGVAPTLRHAANTAALLHGEDTHLDLTRPGIGIFGLAPVTGECPELRPVMKVRTAITALRELEPGQSVGYGSRWTAERVSQVATIPVGYADGLGRNLSGKSCALIGGKRAPLVGTISMDMATLDVTGRNVRLGDEVVIMGEQTGPEGSDRITAHEIADLAGTIPWEILTNVSRRVPRFYRER